MNGQSILVTGGSGTEARGMSALTAERLRQILAYDPATGLWAWKARRSGIRPGQRAGTPNGEGRIQIRIDGVKRYAAPLAWLYMTGEWPSEMVDHINRNNADDRWANLRLATRGENCTNRFFLKPKRPDLPRGVTVHPGGYAAKISVDGKRRHLGLFATPEEASEAYLAASRFRARFLPEAA